MKPTRDRIFIIFSMLLLTIGTSAAAATGAAATGNEMKQYVRVTNTQHADVPAGGTVRIPNTRDELTIQGWDQPGVEITTIKSSKDELGAADREKATREMESIKIAAELKGNELQITTSLPKAGGFLFLRSPHDFTLNYLVKVPRNVHLIVEGSGEAHFEGVAGDIHANMHQGEITLRLPQDGQFGIDASARVGSVISDFPGDTKRRTWFLGHTFAGGPQTARKLYLREGFGDILILKTYSALAPSS
jgi:hypothetical protein